MFLSSQPNPLTFQFSYNVIAPLQGWWYKLPYISPSGQWTPAENTYPGIEAAAGQECRQQQSYEMHKCHLYLKDFNIHLHLAITYDCLADSDDLDTGE